MARIVVFALLTVVVGVSSREGRLLLVKAFVASIPLTSGTERRELDWLSLVASLEGGPEGAIRQAVGVG